MSNTLYEAIKSAATLETEEVYHPTSEFWIAAFQYSSNYVKSSKSLPNTKRILVLKVAYQYTDDDLIHEVTIKLVKSYKYFIMKYYDLRSFPESERIKRFYGIVSKTVSNMLIDMFRHISCDHIPYLEYDPITGTYLAKTGHCIKSTYFPMSLDQTISDDSSDNKDTTLGDLLASSSDSTEDLMIAWDFIAQQASLFTDDPHEMFSYMCLLLQKKIDLIARNLIEYDDNREYFFKVSSDLNNFYGISFFNDYVTDCPNINISYKDYDFHELKKRLSYERTKVRKKVRLYLNRKKNGLVRTK